MTTWYPPFPIPAPDLIHPTDSNIECSEIVTPERARELLTLTPVEYVRARLNPTKIATMIDAMRDGTFVSTGGGTVTVVLLGQRYLLLNGLNRLVAISMSGKEQRLFVSYEGITPADRTLTLADLPAVAWMKK